MLFRSSSGWRVAAKVLTSEEACHKLRDSNSNRRKRHGRLLSPLALGLSLGLRRYKIRYVNYPDRRILPSSEIWFSTTSLSVLATISMHLAIILSIFSPLWKRSLCALLSYAHSSCIYYSHRIGQRTTSYASEKYPRHRTFKWK